MTDFEIPPLVPSGSALQVVTGLGAIVRSHLRLDSVWVRAGLRAALGLGLAILIAELAELQHAFWVVLATLTVLKSNAVSTGYAAWQALAGTLAGFGLASAVVIGVGDAQPALWALLPVCVFLAVYTPTVVHVVVGQAMFTVTIIVLFNLIEPEGWRTGLIRVEDILIGAGTAILVGALLWPRGARAQLRASLASLYETGSAYVRAALAATFDHGSQPAEAAGDARAAGLRAGEALSTYLNEHGPKRLPIEVWTKLLVTGEQLHLVGDAIVVRTSAYGRIEPFPQVAAAIQEEARRLDDEVDSVADAIAGRNGAELPTGSHAERNRGDRPCLPCVVRPRPDAWPDRGDALGGVRKRVDRARSLSAYDARGTDCRSRDLRLACVVALRSYPLFGSSGASAQRRNAMTPASAIVISGFPIVRTETAPAFTFVSWRG